MLEERDTACHFFFFAVFEIAYVLPIKLFLGKLWDIFLDWGIKI